MKKKKKKKGGVGTTEYNENKSNWFSAFRWLIPFFFSDLIGNTKWGNINTTPRNFNERT